MALPPPNLSITCHLTCRQVGGFTLPFAIMGSLLFASSIFIYFVLPDIQNPPSHLSVASCFSSYSSSFPLCLLPPLLL